MTDKNLSRLQEESETFGAFRRFRLLRTSFILLVVGLIAGIVANVFLTGSMIAVLWLSVFLLATVGAIVHFLLTKNVDVAAVTLTLIVVASYLVYLEVGRHTVFVLYLFPPVPVVAFYLTGRRRGLIFSMTAFAGTLILLLWNRPLWDEAVFDAGSFTNFLVGAITFLALVLCYELTIHKAQVSLRKINEMLRTLSITDSLTGLHNREWLDVELHRRLQKAEAGDPFAVLICDIDNFKQVNDEHGHIEGDNMLKAFGGVLEATVGQDCRIGRWGGEEFLAICDVSTLHEAVACAERLRKAVEADDSSLASSMTVSIGVAVYEPEDTAVSIIRRADKGLYKAKAEGKNRVRHVQNE